MTYAKQMLSARPVAPDVDADVLVQCIDACVTCAQACTACADACAAEETVADLRRCIQLCLNCADICEATGRVTSRPANFDHEIARATLTACIGSCQTCGAECEHHAQMGMVHCQICAEACALCQAACRALVAVL